MPCVAARASEHHACVACPRIPAHTRATDVPGRATDLFAHRVQGLEHLGFGALASHADALFKSFDLDGSGSITFKELYKALRNVKPEAEKPKAVGEAVQVLGSTVCNTCCTCLPYVPIPAIPEMPCLPYPPYPPYLTFPCLPYLTNLPTHIAACRCKTSRRCGKK